MNINYNFSKGDCVVLTDNHNQTFKGEIKSINPELGRILLTNLIQLPEEKPIIGYRNFDKYEITSLKPFKEGTNLNEKSQKTGEQKETKKPKPKIDNSVLKNIETIQEKYHYINNLGTNFHLAIAKIMKSKRIGMCLKDVSKGRMGRGSILAVSTSCSLFIFDLLTLGDEGLEKGLKDILESKTIIKIVHDSRLLSDCLKHSHLVFLENVRDVEAEDIVIVYEKKNLIRKHNRTLERLVKIYLGVDVKGCEEVGEVWNERPLSPHLLSALVSSVSYLIPLQEAMEVEFLQRLVDASEIYKNYLRDSDLFDFMNGEVKKTLEKEIINLVDPESEKV